MLYDKYTSIKLPNMMIRVKVERKYMPNYFINIKERPKIWRAQCQEVKGTKNFNIKVPRT